MDTVNKLKNKNVIKLRSKKLRSKKLRIQKTKKFATLCIILLSLLIIGTSIKNMYVYFRCSDFIYSLDYYFTHWKDKDLRLIEVDSFSVLSKTNNTVEIEAYGFAYKKPYKETYLIGTFIEDDKGRWHMESVKLKNEESKIENEEDVITN